VPLAELAHLELLAEVDALLAELAAWVDHAPDWPPARHCQALAKRLAARVDTLRVRLDAPLVVATLGGTGTGKSSLVNALVGSVVTATGRQRPTTRQPVLICRPDITAEMLGIDPASVQRVERDVPGLRDVVLLDCPDPDTTEDGESPGTNLARLHGLLPHCDVLLVTSTQQKYRSACVADELARAAPGARLVFVQTHADVDDDIRGDWQRLLSGEYATGEMFFVDSLAALRDAEAGLQPRGEFGRLVELLTRELAGATRGRIRRANFLDLVEQTLAACRQHIDAALPAIGQLERAIGEQRAELAARTARQMREELTGSRGAWENRLLGEVASRWGFSPFACVLRVYHGLGSLLAGATFLRVRTPAQLALWGLVEGGRKWRRRAQTARAESAGQRAVRFGWDTGELRTAAMIVEGYAADAGLPRDETQRDVVEREAEQMGSEFVVRAATELQSLVARLAARHSGWFTRWRYELLLLAMIGLLLYRFARNFFYDSWLAPDLGLGPRQAPLGTDFLVAAAIWLLLWCGLLLWAFSVRLRRGLQAEIRELEQRWNQATASGALFAGLERRCQQIGAWRQALEALENRVADMQRRLAQPSDRLGHHIGR
jgi:50S ribosome-binding GTPase